MKASLPFILLLSLLFVGCGGGTMAIPPPPPPPPTVTGHWTGTIVSSNSNLASNVSGDFTQGQTTANGTEFAGVVLLSNACLSSITITGTILNGGFALSGTASDGSVLTVVATINTQDTIISGTWQNKAGTICSNDNGTLKLTKQ